MNKITPFQKSKENLLRRWSEEDYPGGSPRFQLSLLAKDLVVFGLIPVTAILIFKIIEGSTSTAGLKKTRKTVERQIGDSPKHSQIIQFSSSNTSRNPVSRRAPGTLVRVRLMNTVETVTSAPVHAQIIDEGLGRKFLGGTLIGDATSENDTGRISITFRFARFPDRKDLAVAIAARAMSLDGSFGIEAVKKEGMFARAAIRAGTESSGDISSNDNDNFKTLIARAFAAGMMKEFQSEATVAHRNAQVLTLRPLTEFFVELTDYFPGQK